MDRTDDDGRLTATLGTPSRARTANAAFRLLVVYSPDPELIGVPRMLGSEPLVLGRAAPGLALPDARASRAHAALELRDGRPHVRDLGSRNGTFVNGVRAVERTLADQDVIRVGDHCLVLQALASDDIRRTVETPPRLDALVGDGRAMRALREEILRVAPSTVPVLVLGETGTGKELVASEIHRRSGRSGALVPVNCAAIPEHLAEGELFGHVKGAFTGASGDSTGLFGAADRGTIFLDEIGEMPLALQAKLLRALGTGEVRRVGESTARRVDARVVAATNVDLEAAVARQTFRADLLARLTGQVVRVPPLRERREDLLALASHFLAAAIGLRAGEPISRCFTPDAAEALLVHRFSLNVRELEQVIRGAATGVDGGTLDLPHLREPLRAPIESRAPSPEPGTAALVLARILEIRPDATPSADDLRAVVEHFGGNVSRVAVFFGKERRQIYRWAERHGIDLDASRNE